MKQGTWMHQILVLGYKMRNRLEMGQSYNFEKIYVFKPRTTSMCIHFSQPPSSNPREKPQVLRVGSRCIGVFEVESKNHQPKVTI